MSDTVEAGAEAGVETPEVIAPEVTTDSAPGAAESNDQPAEQGGDVKPPLPPEELEKRWRNTKGAMQAERQARRAAEQRLADLERQLAESRQQAQPEWRPDPEADPVGYLKYLEQRLAADDEQRQAQAYERQQAETQQRAVQTIVQQMNEHEADFRSEHPDYDDAVNHLRQSRLSELTAFGLSPDEANAALQQDFLNVVATALQRGRDPAQAAYDLARQRGFNKQPSKLEAIARGQAAASPLSAAPGKASAEPTVESVANLNGAAFASSFAKLRELARERGW
jgi:hypothetical protein